MKKLVIVIIAIFGVMSFSSCKKNKIVVDYPALKKTKNITEYISIDKAYDIFFLNDDKKYIITLGYQSCQWCQTAIRYINDIALEKNYEKTYYLDIKELSVDKTSAEFDKYLDLLLMIESDIEMSIRVVPTVIVVRNGRVIAFHEKTVEGHEKIDGVLPPLSDNQIIELKEIYRSIF